MITQGQLEQYYELWLEGSEPKTIQEVMGLDDKKFDALTPHFLVFCRNKVKHDVRATLASGKPPAIIEATPERKVQFLSYVETGLPYDKIAKIMNVPLITILDYWLAEDPVFKVQCEVAVELSDAEVIMAMKKRAVGFTTETETETTTEGMTEKGRISTTVKSKTKQFIAPDTSAGKFWLINRKPEQFSADGEVNRKGNKGKIMDAIDKIIGEPSDAEEVFQEE